MRYSNLFISLCIACTYAAQPDAVPPVEAPLRELQWEQLNILHTTDIHGWLGGHLQEYALCPCPTMTPLFTAL